MLDHLSAIRQSLPACGPYQTRSTCGVHRRQQQRLTTPPPPHSSSSTTISRRRRRRLSNGGRGRGGGAPWACPAPSGRRRRGRTAPRCTRRRSTSRSSSCTSCSSTRPGGRGRRPVAPSSWATLGLHPTACRCTARALSLLLNVKVVQAECHLSCSSIAGRASCVLMWLVLWRAAARGRPPPPPSAAAAVHAGWHAGMRLALKRLGLNTCAVTWRRPTSPGLSPSLVFAMLCDLFSWLLTTAGAAPHRRCPSPACRRACSTSTCSRRPCLGSRCCPTACRNTRCNTLARAVALHM